MNVSENNQNCPKRNLLQGIETDLPNKQTDVYHIDGIWSLGILDLKDYGPENKRGYR